MFDIVSNTITALVVFAVTSFAIKWQNDKEARRIGSSMRESVYREITNNYILLRGLNTSMVNDVKQEISHQDEVRYVCWKFDVYLVKLKSLRDGTYTSFKSNPLFLKQLNAHELYHIEKIYDEIFWTLQNETIADQRHVVPPYSNASTPRDMISLEQQFIALQLEMLESLIRKLDKNLLIKDRDKAEVQLIMQLFLSEEASQSKAIIMAAYAKLKQRREDAQKSEIEPNEFFDLDDPAFGRFSEVPETRAKIYKCLIKMQYIEPPNANIEGRYYFKLTELGERYAKEDFYDSEGRLIKIQCS